MAYRTIDNIIFTNQIAAQFKVTVQLKVILYSTPLRLIEWFGYFREGLILDKSP